jgi:hypothetical protein
VYVLEVLSTSSQDILLAYFEILQKFYFFSIFRNIFKRYSNLAFLQNARALCEHHKISVVECFGQGFLKSCFFSKARKSKSLYFAKYINKLQSVYIKGTKRTAENTELA